MKLNETIELNGKEYTVELNRESALRIEQYTKIKDADAVMRMEVYEDKSDAEISEDEDPFASVIDEDEIEKLTQKKEEYLKELITRAFWIWLFPVEKLSLNQVKEILKSYFEDDEKANYIAEKYTYFSKKAVEVRAEYLKEQKNLRALAK